MDQNNNDNEMNLEPIVLTSVQNSSIFENDYDDNSDNDNITGRFYPTSKPIPYDNVPNYEIKSFSLPEYPPTTIHHHY